MKRILSCILVCLLSVGFLQAAEPSFVEIKNFVHPVAFSPDGKKLLAIVYQQNDVGTSTIFDAETGKELHTLAEANQTAFSPDGKRILTLKGDRGISIRPMNPKIWDVESGKELYKLEGALDATFSPDGKKIVSSAAGAVKFFDAESGKELQKLDGFLAAHYSPDGKRIILYDGEIRKNMDAESGKILQMPPGWFFDVSPDGKKIALGSKGWGDKTIQIIDAESGKELHKMELLGGMECFYRLEFSPDNKKFMALIYRGTAAVIYGMCIWDTESGEELAWSKMLWAGGKEKGFTSQNSFKSATFWADGRIVVKNFVGTQILDGDSGKILRTFPGYTCVFSPDKKKIATAMLNIDDTMQSVKPYPGELRGNDRDYSVRIYDVESGKELQKLEGHTKQVSTLIFSPDGKRLVTSQNGSTRIWTLE
jgi:WD40 repeat protein